MKQGEESESSDRLFPLKYDQRRTMSDETTAKCMECGATSGQKVLLSCVKDDSQTWVCVHCLPMLIHGAH